uniref:Protein TIC 214 n=1 Tax=Tylosema fassoglense TaxID=228518 RepID=A0A2S0SUN2_9FABA|nr:hypothetical protein RF1 [Tylosema fassoglense]YP_009486946.1 hypothetical protein RF1 [Tylosema fassoglense]AWB13157.1 hypothetical protein RF1 [Tylosema fassoglense]AWB13169.1 hypothetical protein RF1 [Tylosema fassoglense]
MFKSFILDNLISLLMKIMNSVVVVGLYYGFLTTFSIGPSYFFLLRAGVLEEGTEKKVAATTGVLTGQLIMFISIYYAPLHLALGRPHTITAITLPYLLFHFFCNKPEYFWDYEDIRKDTLMQNLSIQMIFLNNLLFQLLNFFILPSSILVRLINIYLFRSNNQILFLTSSLVGWLIGQILFIKSVGFLLAWIQQNNSIFQKVFQRSLKYILKRSNKYIMYQVRYYMHTPRIVFILLYIICLYDLGRRPAPILNIFFNKKMKKILEPQEQERGQIEEQQEQNGSDEEDLSYYLFSKETENLCLYKEREKKKIYIFERPPVTTLFDYNQRYRPLRYIKNDRFEQYVRNEMSQYFFYTCQSDGKERISFTYPPSLSTFVEMMQKKMSLFTTEKISSDELYNSWNSTNEQKKNNLSNKFLNRVEVLDKIFIDGLEKRSRLSNDKTKKKYLPSIYDPFLNGSYRGQIQKNEIDTKNDIWINLNKIIESLLLNINTNYPEYEQIRIDSEEKQKKFKFLFDKMITDPNDKTIVNRKKSIRIKKEIKKKVPRWLYRLIDELEEVEGERGEIEVKNEEEEEIEIDSEDYDIRLRELRRSVIFSDEMDLPKYPGERKEFSIIEIPPHCPDFRRNIIKGSMRAQRRKAVIWGLSQKTAHSPLFWDQRENDFFSFLEDLLDSVLLLLTKEERVDKQKELEFLDRTAQKLEDIDSEDMEEKRIKLAEDWDNIAFGQELRSFLLIIISIFRKYILVPLLIITKNIVRIVLFQTPEWSEDLNDWKREAHIKCNYEGLPISENDFPKNWITEGIQIKVVFPFRLKPWHKSKSKKHQNEKIDSFYLTVSGFETDLPFCSSFSRRRNEFVEFFSIIFKELRKRMKKWKNQIFLYFKMRNERTKWIIKKILFVKEIIKKLKKKMLFGLRQRYELSETQKDSTITKKDSTITNSNQMIYESSIPIQSINWTNYSLTGTTTEEKIKDLNDRTNRIIKEIDKKTNDKKKGFISPEINISSNKATYNNKRLDLQKNIWQLLKRRNVRLVRKSHSFLKFFIERAYIDIFLCIINISRINIQLFLESTKKKKMNKYISNNKANEERIHKINQSIIHFFSTIKKLIANIVNRNSQKFLDASSLSQAYVFYKLSQNPVINSYKHKLKSVFEYDGTSLFLTDETKDILFSIVMNQRLNWLNGHYHYNLSRNRWSRLVPKKWRNRINKRGMAQKKELIKSNSYEKKPFLKKKKKEQEENFFVKILTKFHKKEKQQEPEPLFISRKKKLKKQYGYDILSYKSINYAYKKGSSDIYEYRSLLNALDDHRIYGMSKQKLFDNFAVRNFLDDFIYMEQILNMDNNISIWIQENLKNRIYMEKKKNMDRKYFDWRIMNFCRRNKMDMEAWVHNDYSLTPDDEINLSNQKKIFFDWMGMNVEIINYSISISSLKLWFFSKFLIFYNEYQSNPWVIPIKLLFFNFNGNRNLAQNQRETEYPEPLQWSVHYTKMESREQNESKSGIDDEIDFLLKKHWNFQFNWSEDFFDKLMDNIDIANFMLKLRDRNRNLKPIYVAYLRKGKLNLEVMPDQDIDQTHLKFMKNGHFFIEPIRLFRKNDGKLIMYQTIGLSLIHKNKHQFNQNQRESYFFNNFDESITRHHKMTENKEQKHYDLLVPENVLSSRRRRELRILMCLTYRNRNIPFYNENKVKNGCQVLGKSKEDRDKKKLINFKFFLWPNYRLEDLACMNRYWFDTNNGSRFSMLRIRMYPRLKIR